MINRELPHVFVLPEDKANADLANGFQLGLDDLFQKLRILPEAGGWKKVLEKFKSDHAKLMDAYQHRFMVLLIDFDGNEDRLSIAQDYIPPLLKNRVFIIGSFTDPQDLCRKLQSKPEAIGKNLAKDCRENTNVTWGSELLGHNAEELKRLRHSVFPILFK